MHWTFIENKNKILSQCLPSLTVQESCGLRLTFQSASHARGRRGVANTGVWLLWWPHRATGSSFNISFDLVFFFFTHQNIKFFCSLVCFFFQHWCGNFGRHRRFGALQKIKNKKNISPWIFYALHTTGIPFLKKKEKEKTQSIDEYLERSGDAEFPFKVMIRLSCHTPRDGIWILHEGAQYLWVTKKLSFFFKEGRKINKE